MKKIPRVITDSELSKKELMEKLF